eukprot:542683_1
MYTNAGCSRLVDYYFVVSCDDRGIGHIKEKLRHESLAPQNEKTARHAQFALKPKIIDRYPDMNHEDTPLLPWVARTSMPRGIRARTRPPAPTFFTFVGWNTDTSKLYGACLMVFEKIHIKNQLQTVYIPKTLGFVSHYPYFCAFDVFLRCLWHVIPKNLIPLENLLIHYFYDIPAPAPSRKIAYDLGQMQVLLACRNAFDVPILELPMETAFTQLSKDRICFILKLLLLEKRVIFICGDMHQLTPVCELFVSLLFPLRWRHLYMPLLSHTMFQALMTRSKVKQYDRNGHPIPSHDHPMRYRYREDAPFIVGLPRFVYLNPEIQNNMPTNSFLVFLDRNEITDYKKKAIHPNEMKSGKIVPNLPNPLENTLRDAIHTLARILTMQVDGIQQQNQQNTPGNAHHSSSHRHNNKSHSRGNNASSSTIGGHNSMFISREYTLQAFRTMLAVMTKLLYLSAHQQFGNPQMDDDDLSNSSKKSKVDKYANSMFIIKFRSTSLFQSFYAYYKRINGDADPYFKRMYLFYKENQGHGKHFARRQTNNWENEPFDRKLYDKEIFRISRDKISALESNNGKDNKLKKMNEIALKRSKKYSYPIVEFEMLAEVKEFLKMYVWREGRRHRMIGGSNYSQSPRSRFGGSRRASRLSHGRKRKGSKSSHRKKKSKESFYYSPSRKKISAASPASTNTSAYGLYPIPYENGTQSTTPISINKKEKSRHTRHKSKSKSKSSRRTRKNKKRKSTRHTINTSNSLDITDLALQRNLERFCQDLTANKDNLEKQLALCLEIETKIQRKIAKINDIDRSDIMNDVGSIHGAAINIGYKSIDKSKGSEHWKMIVYEIFRDDPHQGKYNLTTCIGKLCGNYPQHKKDLTLLRSVVALFDDELSVASGSVRSLFLNQNGKSANSQGSSVSTNTTSTGTGTTATTSTTGTGTGTGTDEESDWDEDSDEEDSSDDEESSSEDDEDGAKKKKKKEESESDWDESSEEESGSEEDESDSSSGWSVDSEDDFDEEKEKDGSFTFDSGCKFTKLDEFALDGEEIEWFDAREQLHNDELGSGGIKFIDEKMKKEEWIAVNVIDEYLIDKWKKNYRQRIKSKQKTLLPSSALDKRQGSTDSNHSSVAMFNINHSVNVYDANNRKNAPPFMSPGSSSSSKYRHRPPPPDRDRSSAGSRSRSKSPKPPSKSPKNHKKKAAEIHMQQPPGVLINVSPKSTHSSKIHQHHHLHNKKHHHSGNVHNANGSHHHNHNQRDHNGHNHNHQHHGNNNNNNRHHSHHVQYHKRKEEEE